MIKKAFVVVLDHNDVHFQYEDAIDEVMEILRIELFRNESIRLSRRVLFCIALMPSYPDINALFDDAVMMAIDRNPNRRYLYEKIVMYSFEAKKEFIHTLKQKFKNEIRYLLER